MSYSEHFRRKILAKLEEGYSIRAVAAQFEINKNTIVEWKKRIEIKKTRVYLHARREYHEDCSSKKAQFPEYLRLGLQNTGTEIVKGLFLSFAGLFQNNTDLIL